ncbi:hypothetical protein IMCC3317_05070 [Kordia antarctica]|uniref:Uncharacterized protein n=1 Tax=Kordia antarctica TaxID=1218801 RepID=A0A7L4ZFE8_9FLAO|nr:hypothetical protein IMCC3317_05070 [Kordia antarctica]
MTKFHIIEMIKTISFSNRNSNYELVTIKSLFLTLNATCAEFIEVSDLSSFQLKNKLETVLLRNDSKTTIANRIYHPNGIANVNCSTLN